MKIRTDFVTNSSSSSFMVTLSAKLSDGTSVNISSFEESGDFDAKGCSLMVKDADGKVLAHGSCEPLEYCMTEMELFDPDDIPWEVWDRLDLVAGNINLSSISKASDAMALKEALARPFGLDSKMNMDASEEDEEYDEEEWDEEFECEDTAEILEVLHERFNEMVDVWDDVMSEHLTAVEDLEKVSVSMEFGGRGEFLADRDQIVDKIFGWQYSTQITDILDEEDEDEDEIKEALRSIPCLTNSSEESLDNLIRFWAECDYSPAMCKVKQELQKDGTVDFTIVWDDDALDF